MHFGVITIQNEGTSEEPSWTLTAEAGGYLLDNESIEHVVGSIRQLRAEGHTFDSISLELENKNEDEEA